MNRTRLTWAPGVERRDVRSNHANWPKGLGFHEESSPAPQSGHFVGVAYRLARQIAPSERLIYLKAVAREATKRVLRLHLFEEQSRNLLVGYTRSNDGPAFAERHAHVAHLRRELAWEREKWSVRRSTFQWRRFSRDPHFLSWLQSFPVVELARWGQTYLPAEQRTMSRVRQAIAHIAPMPQEIHRAYFFATAGEARLLTMSGAEDNLGTETEYHVHLVCQRLLAYHTAWFARHGPAHMGHMAEMLRRHLAFRRQDVRMPEEILDIVRSAAVFTQGRVTKAEADATMAQVNAGVQRARAILERRADLQAELQALTPTRLELQEPCATCGRVGTVAPEEEGLPPFHRLCRCFRLIWRGGERPELERKVILWALECALGHDRVPLFPFDEFFEVCERTRQTRAVEPSSSPASP